MSKEVNIYKIDKKGSSSNINNKHNLYTLFLSR